MSVKTSRLSPGHNEDGSAGVYPTATALSSTLANLLWNAIRLLVGFGVAHRPCRKSAKGFHVRVDWAGNVESVARVRLPSRAPGCVRSAIGVSRAASTARYKSGRDMVARVSGAAVGFASWRACGYCPELEHPAAPGAAQGALAVSVLQLEIRLYGGWGLRRVQSG